MSAAPHVVPAEVARAVDRQTSAALSDLTWLTIEPLSERRPLTCGFVSLVGRMCALIWSSVLSMSVWGRTPFLEWGRGWGSWLGAGGRRRPGQVSWRRTVETHICGLVTCMTGCSSGTGRGLSFEHHRGGGS